jgi:hypothetical protein
LFCAWRLRWKIEIAQFPVSYLKAPVNLMGIRHIISIRANRHLH